MTNEVECGNGHQGRLGVAGRQLQHPESATAAAATEEIEIRCLLRDNGRTHMDELIRNKQSKA